MKVLVAAAGTRGDVQPFAALAARLAARGHRVTFCCDAYYAAMVQDAAVETLELRSLGREALREALMDAFADPHPMARAQYFGARLAAGIRRHSPWLPGRFRDFDLAVLNFVSHMAFEPELLDSDICQATVLHFPVSRRFLDILATSAPRTLFLNTISPHVVPTPPELLGHRYAATGFWFHDGLDVEVPAAVAAFLADGPAPVLVSLGSMAHAYEHAWLIRHFGHTAGALDVRMLIQLPGDVMPHHPEGDPRVLVIGDHPCHNWLLARVASVVHHGGCGTTAAVLRAGLPSVIVPVFADQPAWAAVLERCGGSAGTHRLEDEGAEANLPPLLQRALHHEPLRASAQMLARLIAGEDGLANASQALETFHRQPQI